MALTVNLQRMGSLNRPRGPGVKFVQLVVSITPDTRALRASDIPLQTILHVHAHADSVGSVFDPFIINPGSARNSASFDAMRKRAVSGTIHHSRAGFGVGTHAIHLLLYGE